MSTLVPLAGAERTFIGQAQIDAVDPERSSTMLRCDQWAKPNPPRLAVGRIATAVIAPRASAM